jgi:hypothetical protein
VLEGFISIAGQAPGQAILVYCTPKLVGFTIDLHRGFFDEEGIAVSSVLSFTTPNIFRAVNLSGPVIVFNERHLPRVGGFTIVTYVIAA